MRADLRQTREVNVRSDHAMRSDLDIAIHHGIRPDANRGIQFRAGVNNGSRMNHGFKVRQSRRLPSLKSSSSSSSSSKSRTKIEGENENDDEDETSCLKTFRFLPRRLLLNILSVSVSSD
jgi:hypothetical protein